MIYECHLTMLYYYGQGWSRSFLFHGKVNVKLTTEKEEETFTLHESMMQLVVTAWYT